MGMEKRKRMNSQRESLDTMCTSPTVSGKHCSEQVPYVFPELCSVY